MNKYLSFISIFFVFIFIFCVSATAVFASGDKVRGDKADGPAYQNGECPFIG